MRLLPKTVLDAVLRIEALDDKEGVRGNSLMVAASGGLGQHKQHAVLADIRLLLQELNGKPGSSFGDAA